MAGDLAWDSIDTGREYGPYKYPLADRIDRYLEAIENSHPWHTDRSPWGPPVAPPTVLAAASLRFIDSIAPVPPGTLHAKQELHTAAATRLDRQPIGYGRFAEKYERRGRRWFTFDVRWRDETGLILGRTRTTMAFADKVDSKESSDGERKSGLQPQSWLEPVTRQLTQESMTAYTEDSANAQRGTSIHLHEDSARAAGFPATVAQAMMAADYISEAMTTALGQEWFSNADLSVAFPGAMLRGDTITAQVGLAEEVATGATVKKTYAVKAENQDGALVAAGTASSLTMPANGH